MEALEFMKLEKRNEEEKMFQKAYGLCSSGTVEQIEESLKKQTENDS